MRIFGAENITKTYTDRVLLVGVTLNLNEGDKVGVVGINGTGKSTLLKIVAGIETANSGYIQRIPGVRISYLPQNPEFKNGGTVLEQVFSSNPQLRTAKEYEAKAILTRLGITDFDKQVSLLSGGQKKRVAIAAALVCPCELLILDEPTNHLDSEMVAWLEDFLSKFKGALLMVTHDRYFLDRVANRIVEVDHAHVYSYPGGYRKFLEHKSEREQHDLSAQRRRKSLMKKELAWIQQGPKARGTKSKFRIERFSQLVKEEQAKNPDKELTLASLASRLGKKIIEIQDVSKGYDGKTLISDFSYNLLRNDRIGIIGPNGCGKSTLLDMIAGLTEPDSGSIVRGETVKIGYFSQQIEEVDPDMRVIEYVREIGHTVQTSEGTITAGALLEKFLFPPAAQFAPISRLSGGERRRLTLMRVLMGAPNVLLLDEPTNDLDIETLSILEDFIEGFEGAVIAVSHDRYFLDKIAEHVFVFEDGGKLRMYNGGYTNYMEVHNAELAEKPKPKPKPKKAKPKPAQEAPPRLRFSYKEQREYQTIDEDIEKLNRELDEVRGELERNASDAAKVTELVEYIEELEAKLFEREERWLYLSEKAEQIEKDKKSRQQ